MLNGKDGNVGGAQSGGVADSSSALGAAAAAIMSRTGRKEIPLSEVMGAM